MNPADLVTAAVADALGGAPGRIHVAYSGGLDSTVLLHAARTVGAPVALHVDHGLHAWSARWAAQCAAQCEQWQVPLRCHRAALPAGGNMEAAARHARYAYFADQLEPGDLLLVAHHRDDQVETLLLRLLHHLAHNVRKTLHDLLFGHQLLRLLLGNRPRLNLLREDLLLRHLICRNLLRGHKR